MRRLTASGNLFSGGRSLVAGLGLACAAGTCWSGVYKCPLADGSVAYQALPCPNGKGSALNVPDAPSVEPDFPASPPRKGDSEPEIVGPEPLRQRAREALALLKARDSAAYAVVLGYIGRVEPGERTAMRANVDPPTMFLLRTAASLSVTYIAGSFAHESYHSKLYHDYLGAHPGGPIPRQAWGGTRAEIRCERYAIGVMKRIGAPASEIEWMQAHSDGGHVNDWDYQGEYPAPKR